MAIVDSPRPLSPAQQRVYDRLLQHERRTGAMPDLAELARNLGVHYVSLKQHLEALHTKGYIRFESRGRGRSPLLELPLVATGIPLVGEIPAGPLSVQHSSVEGYLPAIAGTGHGGGGAELFALRVHGYSMADLIQPHDIVLLRAAPPERNGLICAVRVEEDEVTLKYLDRLPNNCYALRPHNPDFPTVEVHGAQLQIDGVFHGLLRGPFAEGLVSSS